MWLPNKEKIEKAAMTLAEVAHESDAAIAKAIWRDKEDRPIGFLLFANGDAADMEEVLAAIEKIEDSWHTETEGITSAGFRIEVQRPVGDGPLNTKELVNTPRGKDDK